MTENSSFDVLINNIRPAEGDDKKGKKGKDREGRPIQKVTRRYRRTPKFGVCPGEHENYVIFSNASLSGCRGVLCATLSQRELIVQS